MNVLKGKILELERDYLFYLRAQEQNITYRSQLVSQIQLLIEQLRQQREMAIIFVREFFYERKRLQGYAEQVLEKAIESGDSEMANCSITFMNYLYGESIFDKLNE